MLSYPGIRPIFNNFIKMFDNIKTKILNYKENLIELKYNYIEKILEIKLSIYNKYLVIKNKMKINYYNYKEKLMVVLNTHYTNFYRYWSNKYDKIS